MSIAHLASAVLQELFGMLCVTKDWESPWSRLPRWRTYSCHHEWPQEATLRPIILRQRQYSSRECPYFCYSTLPIQEPPAWTILDPCTRSPSVTVQMDPYPFPCTCDPACDPQTSLLEGTAWSYARSCQQIVHFSFHYLVTILFPGQDTESRSTDLYLQYFSFVLLWLPFLDRAQDIDCQSISLMFPLWTDNHF